MFKSYETDGDVCHLAQRCKFWITLRVFLGKRKYLKLPRSHLGLYAKKYRKMEQLQNTQY